MVPSHYKANSVTSGFLMGLKRDIMGPFGLFMVPFMGFIGWVS